MAATSINQWKTSGGNSVDIIQQEPSLAIWRPVPFIPILLMSFHEELSLQYSHHLHYGGRDPQVITGDVKFVYEKLTSKSAVNIVSAEHISLVQAGPRLLMFPST